MPEPAGAGVVLAVGQAGGEGHELDAKYPPNCAAIGPSAPTDLGAHSRPIWGRSPQRHLETASHADGGRAVHDNSQWDLNIVSGVFN